MKSKEVKSFKNGEWRTSEHTVTVKENIKKQFERDASGKVKENIIVLDR